MNISASFVALLALVHFVSGHGKPIIGSPVTADTLIDVHSHIVPDFYRENMIKHGYTPDANGNLAANGALIPPWTLEGHLATMDSANISYSILSVSAPGVTYLKGNSEAVKLTRKLNDYMYSVTKKYPTRIGAFCFLPIPNVKASLEEIKYCMEKLDFAGVGLLTNYDTLLLGDELFTPILSLINKRNITTYVHPAGPAADCWEKQTHGYGTAMIDFPIQSTRAMIHLFASGLRRKFTKFNAIWSHGGGIAPFISDRVGTFLSNPPNGALNKTEFEEQLKGYYYDLASAVSRPQLAALKEWTSVDKLLFGTDYPFVPGNAAVGFQNAIRFNAGFTPAQLAGFKNGNALRILPEVKGRIEGTDKPKKAPGKGH